MNSMVLRELMKSAILLQVVDEFDERKTFAEVEDSCKWVGNDGNIVPELVRGNEPLTGT